MNAPEEASATSCTSSQSPDNLDESYTAGRRPVEPAGASVEAEDALGHDPGAETGVVSPGAEAERGGETVPPMTARDLDGFDLYF